MDQVRKIFHHDNEICEEFFFIASLAYTALSFDKTAAFQLDELHSFLTQNKLLGNRLVNGYSTTSDNVNHSDKNDDVEDRQVEWKKSMSRSDHPRSKLWVDFCLR